MREITFPGIGISFNIDSIAISICGIDIYWYAIFIVAAFIIALLLLKRDDGKYNIKFEDVLEVLVIGIPIAFICARLYFVLFKLEDYIHNPLEIFNIRNGGLAIYGGIIGATATIAIYCKIKKIKILDMLDYIVPFMPLGQAIGRWGNFVNGEAHGTITNSIFRMGIVENGNYIEVHPTFLYESICNFILFVLLFKLRNKRKYEGEITYIYLAFYGLVRAIIEGIRTDSLMIGNYRVSQLISIAICIIFTSILIYKKVKEKQKNE